jgi:hypothetical protein
VGPVGQREETEEAPRTEGANRGKHISKEAPLACGLDGPAERSSSLQVRNRLARWTGLDPKDKWNGNLILNFN